MIKFIFSLFLIILLILGGLFTINHYSGNKVVEKYSEVQKKAQKTFYKCNDRIYLEDDGVVTITNMKIENGFSECFRKKISKIEKIIIKDISGKNFEEARILGEMVKENNIPVLIDGTCNTACLDIVLHSPEKNACSNC